MDTMGMHIADITLLEEVGRGHGGVVFRAMRGTEPCLVKLPSEPPESDRAGTPSFIRDALTLARASGTALPRVLQVDNTEAQPYVVMESVDATPLDVLLRHGLTPQDTLRVAYELCSAMHHLHGAGFVYGRLQAGDVLIERERGQVYLLDRGTLTRIHERSSEGADAVAERARISDNSYLGELLDSCIALTTWPPERDNERSALLQQVITLTHTDCDDLRTMVETLGTLVRPESLRRSSFPPPTTAVVPTSSHRGARAALSQLQDAFLGAQRGQGTVLALVGPTGSGKSHLLSDLADSVAADGHLVLAVRCSDTDWTPFAAFKRMLDNHLGGMAEVAVPRRRELLARLRRAAGSMSGILGTLSPQLGEIFDQTGPGPSLLDARRAFIEGAAEFLLRYVDQCGPTLILVDDLQWLDGSSRRVMARIASGLASRGVLLVLSRRNDDSARAAERRLFELCGETPLAQLELGPLSHTEASDIVQGYLGEAAPNPVLVDQLLAASHGTPLSLMEVLDSALEHGYLSPRWGTWHLTPQALRSLELPSDNNNAAARISALPERVRRVLAAAATAKRSASVEVIAAALGEDEASVRVAAEGARDRRILSLSADDQLQFTHDSLREAAFATLPADELPALHYSLAQAIETRGGVGAEYDCELARHYAMAGDLAPARRAYEVGMRAAGHFLARWDDHNALHCLEYVAAAAARAKHPLPATFHLEKAEALWRTGDREESLVQFELALAQSSRRLDRAHILSRIVWVHSAGSSSRTALGALAEAFATLGRPMPENTRIAVPQSVLMLALDGANRRPDPTPAKVEELELLCRLYHLAARISSEHMQPMRFLASSVELARVARQLPPCAASVRGHCVLSFTLYRFGLDRLAQRHQRLADEIAASLHDPVSEATCANFKHIAAAWRGRYDEAREWALHYASEHGHWTEPGEYCHVALGMWGLETSMGRPREALRWLERIVDRISQHPHAPPVASLVEDALVGTLTTLGREWEIHRFRRKLSRVQLSEIEPGGYYHLLALQCRMQRQTETGDFGPQAEALVEEFDATYGRAESATLLATVYYGHVAHGRVQQYMRAPQRARAALLPKVEAAVRDVERHNGAPLAACHAHVLRAHLAWFRREERGAEQALLAAEQIARDIHCVWVLIAAARLRAHMLWAAGKMGAARCQLDQAIALAKQSGHEQRVRWMQLDFDPETITPQAPGRTQAEPSVMAPKKTIRQHLNALLNISRAGSWELGIDRQAHLVLAEMVHSVEAQRGFLFLQEATSDALKLVSATSRSEGEAPTEADCDVRVVAQVYGTGQSVRIEPHAEEGAQHEERAVVCAPLVLNGEVVGVVYLDRPVPREPFSEDEEDLLQALASQVPVTLELARSLHERQLLEQNLQQAQKMEAIGRLAGGIAHDFNNILATIQIAGSTLAESLDAESDGLEEVKDILDVAERGAALTKQLLTFARREATPPRAMDLNAAVAGVLPMLTRLVGSQVVLRTDLAADLPTVLADKARIDQVLLNLVTNARDALRDGGTIRVETRRIEVGEPNPGTPPLEAGTHARLSVIDDGMGMSEEVASKIFDPFFTTKNAQHGTGLGMSTVYGIVKDAGGHIEVHTAIGRGTRIEIFLPTCADRDERPARHPRHEPEPARGGRETLLVVDDDPFFCRVTQRALSASGYRVVTASDADKAMACFEQEHGNIDMIVTDVRMPYVNGSDLVANLRRRKPSLKALWVSGDAVSDLVEHGLLDSPSQFLRKPFAAPLIVRRVREILDS